MRKIIHIDMDCFYAAVEMRQNPALKDRPLAIGGESGRRGVLCTCNYEARKYGVRSAMPTFMALKKCPNLKILPPRFELYRKESQAIREIFKRFTDSIEPLSLDEAYLDVSSVDLLHGSATLIAKAIRQMIFDERQLTASAGIGTNKLIAKIASDENKPNGMCVVTPDDLANFIEHLPVKKLFGVGEKLQAKLAALGIETCKELQLLPLQTLISQFGKMGVSLYQYARGIDNRPVQTARRRKSISVEWTFSEDLELNQAYQRACEILYKRLLKRWQLAGEPQFRKIFVKVKFADFKISSHEQIYTQLSLGMFQMMADEVVKQHQKTFRLLGFGIRLAESTEIGQLEFDYEIE